MRATWLTMGDENPQERVKMWMYCCTHAAMLMALCVCVIPLFSGAVVGIDQKTGDIKEDPKPFVHFILAGCFTVLFSITADLCVGAVSIVYGACIYEPPKELAVYGDEIPPVAPALTCSKTERDMGYDAESKALGADFRRKGYEVCR